MVQVLGIPGNRRQAGDQLADPVAVLTADRGSVRLAEGRSLRRIKFGKLAMWHNENHEQYRGRPPH